MRQNEPTRVRIFVDEVVLEWDGEVIDIQHVDAYRGPLKIGHVDVRVTRVERRARSLPYARGDDARVLPYLAVALAAHLALWGVATRRHPAGETISVERGDRRAGIVARSNFAAASYAAPNVYSDDDSPDRKEPGRGTPMRLDAGASGATEAARTHGHIAVEAAAVEAALASRLTGELARSHAVAGDLAVTIDKSRAFGSYDRTSGHDRTSTDAPLYGGAFAARGTSGLSSSGDARGGRGDTDGTIGRVRTGEFSNGRSEGHGWGGSPPGAATVMQPGVRASIALRDIDIRGDLDKPTVRRFIYRRASELAACFDASGRAEVELWVGAGSTVDRIVASACVARVLRAMQFPHDSGPAEITLAIVYSKST